MQSSHSVANIARSFSNPFVQTHARSHSQPNCHAHLPKQYITSLGAPQSAPAASTFSTHVNPQLGCEWLCTNVTASQAAPHSKENPRPIVLPQLAFCAEYPQRVFGTGSSSSIPCLDTEESVSTSERTSTMKKPVLDRNRKPCGACSEGKRKVSVVPHSLGQQPS